MRKLKIAIDGRPALWDRTGIGTITYNFIKLIQHIDSDNLYYYYFDDNPNSLEERFKLNNCRYHTIKNRLLWANTFVPIQLLKDDIDVYITFLEKDIPFLAVKSKLINTVCDLIPLRYPEFTFRNLLHRHYYSTLMRLSVKKSDMILTISKSSKVDIMAKLNVPENKIKVVTLGVDVNKELDKDAEDILAKYNIKGKYILALGSTEPRKNNVNVIKAFNRLSCDYPSLSLVIVGKKWRGLHFDESLLNERIVLTNFVDDEDMPYIYSNATLMVFSSLYEGFGLPVLEAMSYGVPVITSNVSSLPEVGGDAVLYVNPQNIDDIKEKMGQILNNTNLAESLIEKGFKHVDKFRWESMCNEIVSVCRGMAY